MLYTAELNLFGARCQKDVLGSEKKGKQGCLSLSWVKKQRIGQLDDTD